MYSSSKEKTWLTALSLSQGPNYNRTFIEISQSGFQSSRVKKQIDIALLQITKRYSYILNVHTKTINVGDVRKIVLKIVLKIKKTISRNEKKFLDAKNY